MSDFFEIKKHGPGLARAGVVETPHGKIETPAFVGAATRASVKALTFEQMRELGSEAVLVNTYHLFLRPGPELIKNAGKVAEFSGWRGPTFSDSGGFQIFSLPGTKISAGGVRFKSYLDGQKFEFDAEKSMRAQWQIGADIHMAFDYLEKSDDYAKMKRAEEITEKWLTRCVVEHQRIWENERAKNNQKQFLYAVVQGGDFLDLRKKSAEFAAKQNVDGFGIGGVFTAKGMLKMLEVVDRILPETKPRHLLGMGQEPRDVLDGVLGGCDTFDCVGPTRMARNGSLYTTYGRINIKNAKFREDFRPIDEKCECETCRKYSRSYLHHLFNVDEITGKILASIHNEYFVVNLAKMAREAILEDRFLEFREEFLGEYYN